MDCLHLFNTIDNYYALFVVLQSQIMCTKKQNTGIMCIINAFYFYENAFYEQIINICLHTLTY